MARRHLSVLWLATMVCSLPLIFPALSAEMADDPIGRKIQQLPLKSDETLSASQIIEQSNTAHFSTAAFPAGEISPMLVKLQVLLARKHVSPGVIDGFPGGNLDKAIAAFQRMMGLEQTGQPTEGLWHLLTEDAGDPVLKIYEVQAQDVAGPFVANMPKDYAQMAELKMLAYRDPAELLAEKFHMDEKFLRRINAATSLSTAGSKIFVADVGAAQTIKVTHVVADKEERMVFGFAESGKLIVAYPATIGSSNLPSPVGRHAVKTVVQNPGYSYRPNINFKQGNNTKALQLPPGPNGPVGSVWIGLDKPTYGIHGSPEPSKIDKANSHGCVRLTNWDAQELSKLVEPGVIVDFTGDPAEGRTESRSEPATE